MRYGQKDEKKENGWYVSYQYNVEKLILNNRRMKFDVSRSKLIRCKRLEARMQGHMLGLWDAQRNWIELLKYKKVGGEIR